MSERRLYGQPNPDVPLLPAGPNPDQQLQLAQDHGIDLDKAFLIVPGSTPETDLNLSQSPDQFNLAEIRQVRTVFAQLASQNSAHAAETVANLRLQSQLSPELLSETLTISNQSQAEATAIHRTAEAIIDPVDPTKSLTPDEARSTYLIQLRNMAQAPVLFFARGAEAILEKIEVQGEEILAKKDEALAFVQLYQQIYGLYLNQYSLATGKTPELPRQVMINTAMAALSLRSPQKEMEALCHASWKERKRTDPELHYGERSSFPMIFQMGRQYQHQLESTRFEPERAETNSNRGQQFGLWIEALAQQWRQDQATFFDRQPKDKLTILYLHQQDESVVPLKLELDLHNLPTSQDLSHIYEQIQQTNWAGEYRLDAGKRRQIRHLAYQPVPVDQKQADYQQLATGIDAVVQFQPDEAQEPAAFLHQLESNQSLFINFNQAVFNLCLGVDSQDQVRQVGWKTKHYELDGVESRQFFEEMATKVISNASTSSATSRANTGLVYQPVAVDLVSQPEKHPWQEIIDRIPHEIWATTLIDSQIIDRLNHQISQVVEQKHQFTSPNGKLSGPVKTSLNRVLAQARIIATQPENSLTHFMTSTSPLAGFPADLDVASLALPAFETDPTLYQLLAERKAGVQVSQVDAAARNQAQTDLFQSSVGLRTVLKLAQEHHSIVSVLSAVVDPAEELLQSTADLIGGNGFGSHIKGGGMSSAIDFQRDYTETAIGRLRARGIDITDFDEEITRLVLFGTANTSAYQQDKPTRHGGVQGLATVEAGQMRLVDRYSWNQLGKVLQTRVAEIVDRYTPTDQAKMAAVPAEDWFELMQAFDSRHQGDQILIRRLKAFRQNHCPHIRLDVFVGVIVSEAHKLAAQISQDQVLAADMITELMYDGQVTLE